MPRPKLQRNEIKYKYSKHQIVWAKTAGYRWWPASITSLPSKSKQFYKVDFIGDRSYALLSEQKLAPYLDFRDQYETNKKSDKHFINAVTIAAKKYEQLLLKQMAIMKSKGSVECKTSQQKQQLNKQIELPQIPENIQQISSLNQQLQLCSVHLTPQLDIEDQQKKQLIEQSGPSQQLIQQPTVPMEDVQKEQQVEPQVIDQQDRQKLIQQLLAKYKLDCIPELKQFRKPQLQKLQNEKKKLHWKRKLISKRQENAKKSSIYDFSQEDLLSRRLYIFLMAKLESTELSRNIAISLKDQIVREKIERGQCVRKVFEWINTTQSQNIVNYHGQWINFYKDNERQRQKHSNLTMQDQSEQILIK